jgi:hypothetical protein
MFDREAGQCWQVGVTPVASVAALRALAALLHDAAGTRDIVSQTPDSSATSSSQEAIPGDADATPTSTTTTRVVHPPQRRRSGPGAALADVAGGGAGDAAHVMLTRSRQWTAVRAWGADRPAQQSEEGQDRRGQEAGGDLLGTNSWI